MEVSENMLLAGLIVGILILSLVPIVGGFLHYRRDRLLTHAERLKALELGRELPGDPATAQFKALAGTSDSSEESSSGSKAPAAQCYSTTGYVCATGFVFAWLAASSAGVAYAIAAASGAIGVTGMICGTILASKAMESAPAPTRFASKPRFDPEAI